MMGSMELSCKACICSVFHEPVYTLFFFVCPVLSFWKDGLTEYLQVENENTLKTKLYQLTHNFGHGDENLSAMMLTLNLLAFLTPTVLGLMDAHYQLLRQKLVTKATGLRMDKLPYPEYKNRHPSFLGLHFNYLNPLVSNCLVL
jgi:ABC-type Fe3+ transport system permease subunit